jgi:hypothetical protein
MLSAHQLGYAIKDTEFTENWSKGNFHWTPNRNSSHYTATNVSCCVLYSSATRRRKLSALRLNCDVSIQIPRLGLSLMLRSRLSFHKQTLFFVATGQLKLTLCKPRHIVRMLICFRLLCFWTLSSGILKNGGMLSPLPLGWFVYLFFAIFSERKIENVTRSPEADEVASQWYNCRTSHLIICTLLVTLKELLI